MIPLIRNTIVMVCNHSEPLKTLLAAFLTGSLCIFTESSASFVFVFISVLFTFHFVDYDFYSLLK